MQKKINREPNKSMLKPESPDEAPPTLGPAKRGPRKVTFPKSLSRAREKAEGCMKKKGLFLRSTGFRSLPTLPPDCDLTRCLSFAPRP